MATLLWCTILIIYRIVRVGGVARRTRVYQRLIEMLVESALLYSAVIVVLLVFEARNETFGNYAQEVAIAMRVRLTRFDLFFLMTTTLLLGNRAYNFGRPRCSRACAPRRLLEWKYHSVIVAIQRSFKFTE